MKKQKNYAHYQDYPH